MANATEQVMRPMSKSETRKANKPMVEKRRRERINSCLEELKGLVLHALQKDTPEHSKLEKADILELTVSHLRSLQKQQECSGSHQDNHMTISNYKSGFSECASEISRYLNSTSGVENRIRERIVGHLNTCVRNMNTAHQDVTSVSPPHAIHEPVHVKIPVATPSVVLPGNSIADIPALAVMRTGHSHDVIVSPNKATNVVSCAVAVENQRLVYANMPSQPFGLYLIKDPQRYIACPSTSPLQSHRNSCISSKVKTSNGTTVERAKPVWRPW